jgi:hypothetical protein
MSINQLAIGADVEQGNPDSLGGGYTKKTGLYPCTIDMASMDKSKGGALSLNLHLKVASDQSIIRQTLWVTSGDAKGNKNYYVNQNGKKFLLPGMQLADQIARIAAGCPMSECNVESKTVKLWDRDAGAEKPREVPVVTSLLGQPILVGLMKHRENRNVNDGSGNYVPSKEERIYNEIDKVFHSDGFSVTEKEAEAEEAKFHQQWAAKYPEDYVEDNYDPNVAGPEDDSLPEAASADTSDLFS